MLACHPLQNKMVAIMTTSMSTSLRGWETAPLFNGCCSGGNLLVISVEICPGTRLCPLMIFLCRTAQTAEDDMPSSKVCFMPSRMDDQVPASLVLDLCRLWLSW